jgi:hypothetical protein
MIYTNSTGKFIGECMTGFGINYPVYIYNSGNSEVVYTITSSDDNFLLSNSRLIISNGNFDNFDIFFNPTSLGTSGHETSLITISSESTEDGSVDPSGDIIIYATGLRIVDTTGGHVRNFRALKNYDPDNGLSYTFYWRQPTGTGYLNNYFVTGYGLDIATDTAFSTKKVSKTFSVAQNSSTPKYSTNYGFADEDIFQKIEAYDDGSAFLLDQSYYARMYSWIDGVTGEAVYATGINQLDTQLSNEVLTGNMSNKVDLMFTKNSLDIYISPQSIYTNYNLYEKIVLTNKGNKNFKYISGINVYLPDLSNFTANDEDQYCLNLNGELKNFTGDATYGTNINIYLSNSTKLLGYAGKGGDLKGSIVIEGKERNIFNFNDIITKTTAAYNSNPKDPTCSDSKNGGSIFNFNIVSTNIDKIYTDLNYNIFSEINSVLNAGGGGSKACVAWIYGNGTNIPRINGIDNSGNEQNFAFPLFGNLNINKTTSYTVYPNSLAGTVTVSKDGKTVSSALSRSNSFGQIGSWPCTYGEDAERLGAYILTNSNNTWFSPNAADKATASTSTSAISSAAVDGSFYFRTITSTTSTAGKIINGASNVKSNFYIKSGNVASDYVFRFQNSAIDSTNKNWKDTTATATLAGSIDTGIFNNDYLGTGLKSVSLNGSQYVEYQFTASSNLAMVKKNCTQFDMYMVVAYRPITTKTVVNLTPNPYITSKFKLLDWSLDVNKNVISKQIMITDFPGSSTIRLYRKESNVFQFFVDPLFNTGYDNSGLENALWWNVSGIANNNLTQLSKSLLNVIDYYPMLINIKRTGSIYSVYVNGNLIISYSMGSFVEFADSYVLPLIENTTLKLISGCTTASETMSYFDIIFYNRLLNIQENQQLNNSLLNTYFKLFTGGTTSSLNIKTNQVRLPNAFNLAGKAL